MNKKVLLISVEEVIKSSVIEDNIDLKLLAKTISIVQETAYKPIIGKALFEGLTQAVYDCSVSGVSLSEAYINLIEASKPYIIAKTVSDFIIINNFKVTNKGVQKLNDNSSTSLSSGDIEGVKQYYNNLISGYKSDLVQFLKDSNLIDYRNDLEITNQSTGWFFEGVTLTTQIDQAQEASIDDYVQAESTYTYQQLSELNKVLLISVNDVFANSPIEDNVDVKLLARTIQQVQQVNLKPILTEGIYNNVLFAVQALSLSGEAMSSLYSDLLSIIKPYLINKTVAEFVIPNQYKFTAKGLMKMNVNSASDLSDGDLTNVKDYYDNLSTTYKESIIAFLKKYKLTSIYSDDSITSDASGWFFEGGLTPVNSGSQGNISPLANDNYTISATLDGRIAYFNTNNALSAYTLDLSTLVITGGSVSGAYLPLSGGTLTGALSGVTYFGDGSNLTGINTSGAYLPLSGGSLAGALIGTSFSAASISGGSIYVNGTAVNLAALTADSFVTGCTYNPSTGVISIYRNDGVILNASGLVTANTVITAVTFSNNTLAVNSSDGTSKSALINNLTGLTVTGAISATTYYGNGANLTGIASGPGGNDTQVQYNNGGILTGTSFYTVDNTNKRFVIGVPSGNDAGLYIYNSGLGASDTAAVRIQNPEAFSTLFITPSTSSLPSTTGFFAGTGNGFLIYPQAKQALRALSDRVYVFGDSDAGNFGVGLNNPLAKLHVLGNSILGGGVSAVTISATTFYGNGSNLTGLPTFFDTNITGASFSNNRLTLTNNTGGTVSTLINNFTGLTVNGIISATTVSATTFFGNGANLTGIVFPIEIYTTGGTFTNNNLVYTNNTGGTVSTLINNFSGLTVNGSISAVTVSATTFFGNGVNLTGLPTFTDSYFTGGTYSAGTLTLRNNTGTTISISGFSTGGTASASVDSYVTGGTYSNGVITFTNNTGTTFNVTGLFTGSTDVRITGGTFSNNILTLTNNTGGTVSTVINNFSGLTVNGIISATTISASTFVGNGAGLTGVIGSNERITGGTFSNNSLTLTNTTGGTVSTTINNFTGVTVNGLLSAATITASTLSVAGNVNEAFNGIIVGSYCHVEGNNTSANGSYAHAEGFQSNAIGDYTHAEGGATQSSGTYSHAEGVFSIASGQGSHAEGYSTTANINGAHAEGSGTTASGTMSHAEGSGTTASGQGAHAEGLGTIAAGNNQHVEGTYNNSNTTALMIIGNGTSAAARADLAIFNQNTIVFNKPVGLSVQVPLANLHITGGTTTVAPMILASGTTLLTPINGTVEYNGSNLFFTPTGATRQTVIVGQTGTTPVTTGSVNTWLAVSINGIQYKIPMYK